LSPDILYSRENQFTGFLYQADAEHTEYAHTLKCLKFNNSGGNKPYSTTTQKTYHDAGKRYLFGRDSLVYIGNESNGYNERSEENDSGEVVGIAGKSQSLSGYDEKHQSAT